MLRLFVCRLSDCVSAHPSVCLSDCLPAYYPSVRLAHIFARLAVLLPSARAAHVSLVTFSLHF